MFEARVESFEIGCGSGVDCGQGSNVDLVRARHDEIRKALTMRLYRSESLHHLIAHQTLLCSDY